MQGNKQSNLSKDFLWGASTSAYQVEGNSRTQWTEWEIANADRQAKKASRRYLKYIRLSTKTWHRIKDQAEDPENYINGPGVDHYNRYQEDFDILKQLNFNSFRFGIEWSRIEPTEGQWDQAAIDHYKKYIAELKKRNIEPVINLWHWTNPIWFEEKGAFLKRKNIKYFERFVEKITQELLTDINYVIVINEANNYALLSYLLGYWPPQKRNVVSFVRCYYHLMLAQKRSYAIIKSKKPNAKVGTAHSVTPAESVNKYNPVSRLVEAFINYTFCDWFYARIKNHQDFIGANYYQTHHVRGVLIFNFKNEPRNDIGWYMEPRSVGKVASRLYKKFGKEVIITENGLADAQDQHRKWWIQETLAGLEEAAANGVRISGYFHWSLLDNFEWAEGWWPKFGLVEVDRKHDMKRTIRPSAKWFGEELARRQKHN